MNSTKEGLMNNLDLFGIFGLFFGIVFYYFHIYRPPRAIHNEEDLQATLDNVANYLEYDLVVYNLKPANYEESVEMYIFSEPGMTEGLLESLNNEINDEQN